MKPLNIPEELQKSEYLKRAYNIKQTTFPKVFIKSKDKIKGYTGIVPTDSIPEGNYIISEIIDIDSEWRTFVYNGDMVGLQNYSGDFTVFPNVHTIKDMINDYKSAPKAYTLDVGVNKNGTFIIECHDFFSCGMYGFADYKVIPAMYIATWNKLISK